MKEELKPYIVFHIVFSSQKLSLSNFSMVTKKLQKLYKSHEFQSYFIYVMKEERTTHENETG